MSNTDEIRKIISDNRDNLAFLIGNGIHYQFKDCELSWDNLIKQLWRKYVDDRDCLIGDMSLTEIYDIIEINAIEIFQKEEFQRQKVSLSNILKEGKFKDLFDRDAHDIFQKVSQLSQNSHFQLHSVNTEAYGAFQKGFQRLTKGCRNWCNSNIEGSESLSDEQCISEMLEVICNPSKIQIFRNLLKREVGSLFPSKESYKLADCISYIKRLNVPILTTNFDTYISDSVGAKRFINDLGGHNYKFTDFYPWNVYYSTDKLNGNILDNFGIWHINGMTDYPRSIRLGLSDYMGCVERARGMIQGNNLNEYFTGKQQSYWKGYNTWLHIIFNRNLFIFGLALEQNEVFLRWLLIQRLKYSRLYNRNLHGWYVGKDIDDGKRYFLEFLGFKVIELLEFDELYNTLK